MYNFEFFGDEQNNVFILPIVVMIYAMENPMCNFFTFFKPLIFFSSSNLQICTAFDRYYAVATPMGTEEALVRQLRFFRYSIFVAFFAALPQWFVYQNPQKKAESFFDRCYDLKILDSYFLQRCYNFFAISYSFLVPLIALCIIYWKLYWQVIKIKNNITGETPRDKNNLKVMDEIIEDTVRMIVVTMMTFLICTLPFFYYWNWYMIDPLTAQKAPDTLPYVVASLYFFNIAMGPLICGTYAGETTAFIMDISKQDVMENGEACKNKKGKNNELVKVKRRKNKK